MSKPLNRLILFFIALVLLIGFTAKSIFRDQVIALSPPELPTPTPTLCYATGNDNVLHVYAEGNHSGCYDLREALHRVATQTSRPSSIFIHSGAYNLNTQDFDDSRSPSFGVLLRDVGKFTLKGETGSNGENLVTINVSGNKGLFLLENSTVTLESLNFSGSTTNGLLHAENDSNLIVRKVRSEYSGSNVFEATGANSVSFYQNHISGGVGAIYANDVNNTSILYNTITNNSRGIVVSNGPANIKYNLLIDNSSDGHSINLTNSESSYIGNNTIIQTKSSFYDHPLKISQPHLEAPTTVQLNIISSTESGVMVDSNYENAINFQSNNLFAAKAKYTGINDRTGLLGNISSDPLFGNNYCLQPNSPSLLSNGLFMGHTGQCESHEPTPAPQEPISRIHINPGQLTATIGSERILFSAQAMKLGSGDVENATYEWGMSSDNSIGTLFSDPSNQKQAWFTPVRAGRGDIWVTVRIGDYYKTASVPVVVNKLCQERNSCTSDACIQIVPPGGWCASEALPGDVDFNNSVNYQDVIKFKAAFDKKFYPADFNFDGKVNIYDFLLLVKHFGLSLDILDVTKEPISESGGTN